MGIGYCLNNGVCKYLMTFQHMLQSEIILARITIMTLAAYAMSRSQKVSLYVPVHMRSRICARAFFGTMNLITLTLATRILPLTVFLLILFTDSFSTAIL
jgi:hypothetical protein